MKRILVLIGRILIEPWAHYYMKKWEEKESQGVAVIVIILTQKEER